MQEYLTSPPDPMTLDKVGDIGASVNQSLHVLLSEEAHMPKIWVGETGPHNGKSPGVLSDANMRWANFADAFWYMDAMASKARAGYDAFCRQDFVGIDYGLLNPRTNDPLPDYFAGLLWRQTMGSGVVNAVSNVSDHVRGYAHCTPTSTAQGKGDRGDNGDDLTVLLMNLQNASTGVTEQDESVTVTLEGITGCSAGACPHTLFTLSGPAGTNSTLVALNGETLSLDPHTGLLPPMPFSGLRGNDNKIQLAPATIAFVVIDGAGKAAGC